MLTVLLTTFNDSSLLKLAVSSILSQSFINFELLVIDDGSTDNTFDVINNFNDKRIRYIMLNHVGRSKALNLGLREAKYDWIVLADSDDIMFHEKLKNYVRYISDKEDRIVWSNCYYFRKSKILFYIENPVDESDIKKLFLLHSLNNCCLINRNHIFKYSDGYNEKIEIAEDYDLWLKLIFYSELIVIPEFLTLVNLRLDSFSRSNNSKN